MYNEKVNVGDVIMAETGSRYIFIYEEDDINTPYKQVDIDTFEIIDAYPFKLFEDVKIGFELTIGGKVRDTIPLDEINL